MMAAIGACLGLPAGAVTLVSVALVGGVMGVGVSLVKREGRSVASNLMAIAYGLTACASGYTRLSKTRQLVPAPGTMRMMPYGVSIFIGVCVAAVITY